VRLSEGKATFESIDLRKRGEHQSILLVSLKEGKNRQIRRVFAKLGLKVTELARVRVGGLTDRGLKKGDWRPLLPEEVAGLLAIARGEARAERPDARGRARGRPPQGGPRSGARPARRPRRRGGER